MIKALIFLLGTFVLSMAWAPFFIGLLYKYKVGKRVRSDGPSSHEVKIGIPTMAGAWIIITVSFITLLFNFSREATLIPLFTLIITGILGGIDDALNIFGQAKLRDTIRGGIRPFVTFSKFSWNFYNILLLPWNSFKEIFRAIGSYPEAGFKPHEKVLTQTAVGFFIAFWFYFKLGFHEIWLPLLGFLDISYFYIPAVTAMIVIVANAVNFTDGLDGLAGGLLAISYTALAVIALSLGFIGIGVFCATLVGGLLAFLYFNIYPARVFMGDVGSLSLGATLAVVSLLLRRELVLLIIGGVFAFELLSVLIQVGSCKLGRGRVFKMAPIHHHFELGGWPEAKVTMRFWLAGAVLAFLGVLVALL